MKATFLSLCLCLSSICLAQFQNAHIIGSKFVRTTLSVIEFAEILESSKDSVLRFLNCEITQNFRELKKSNSKYWVKSDIGISCINFKTDVWFVDLVDCKLPDNFDFYQCEWNNLSVTDCELSSFRAFSCIFHRSVTFDLLGERSDGGFADINLIDCLLKGGVHIGSNDRIRIQNCHFQIECDDMEEICLNQTGFFRCEEMTKYPFFVLDQFSIEGKGSTSVTIEDSEFSFCYPAHKIHSFEIIGRVKNVQVHNTAFESVNFADLTVEEYLLFENSKITKYLYLDNANLPPTSTNLPWEYLKDAKIVLIPNRFWNFDPPYTGESMEHLDQVSYFNELMSKHKMLHTIYHSRGERMSANGCYVRMKDLETVLYRHQYYKTRSFNDWFDWRFNQFLKLFSDYGTDPVKSLIFSIYVMLFFAVIYFVFYTGWNCNSTRGSFTHLLFAFADEDYSFEQRYFKRVENSSTEWDAHFRSFRREHAMFPIYHFGYLIYLFRRIQNRWKKYIFRLIDQLKTPWDDTSKEERFYQYTVLILAFILGSCYLIGRQLVNSMALSVNTFSTLGFGRIPVHGFLTYVTILEGFAGWFLLSVLSVTIVNQLIQG